MPRFDFIVETAISRSARARQLEAIFDVPSTEKCTLKFAGDMPLDERPWNVGLIVGPSGCGKSSILREVFGGELKLEWNGASVVDDFAPDFNMQQISDACMAVGFNTIPAWLRPYRVLSNGEKFRVELARRMLEGGKASAPIIVDEFTSVVDRQVAQIGSNAVQKYARKSDTQLIAASCHYDIIDWLQPDWILEPATMAFQWRALRRRPAIDCTVRRTTFEAWQYFAPYHYLTAHMNTAVRCFALFIGGRVCAFAGMIKRPHARAKDIWGCTRLVTLPDWQGLGLAFVLIDAVSAMYKTMGQRVHTYPAHPPLVRAFGRSTAWEMHKRAGTFDMTRGDTSGTPAWKFGSRPCAVFEYVGAAHADTAQARAIIETDEREAPPVPAAKRPRSRPSNAARPCI